MRAGAIVSCSARASEVGFDRLAEDSTTIGDLGTGGVGDLVGNVLPIVGLFNVEQSLGGSESIKIVFVRSLGELGGWVSHGCYFQEHAQLLWHRADVVPNLRCRCRLA